MKSLKRYMMLILIVTFLVILSACGDEASTTNEEGGEDFEITLTYSDHDPPGAMRTDFVENVWIPEIEKQTNGQVKVNANFGGSLLSSQEVLEGAADGVTDMAMIFPDFYPERLFTYQIYKLFPEAPEKWENISTIFEESVEELPKLNEELEALNQKPLLVTVGLPTVFGASYEIDGIEDIIGKDWRASSRWHLESMKHIGANPVSVPWEDVYMSLETGVIDGVMTNYDGFHAMKFYEGAQDIIVGPQLWWASPFTHTINLDVWNDLPEDVQEGILKATEIAQEKFGEVYASALENTIEAHEEAGVNVKMADEEDVAYFTDEELLNNLRNTWIEEAKANHGIEDAEEYINSMLEIMQRGLDKE
ncbi:TRAP transporter substrate-binding protein DctP [Virgibacillus byunsanensis]|uniref:TRAP transporter substrate-binding protein DctP n=1 Tax=Virgibacillus byunsanensis TaxID=570945 RepID=A0ABW3LN23_9BACI